MLPRQTLANYLALRERLDQFARRVTEGFASDLACRAGCDSCCRHLTLFPVEAYAVLAALHGLPAEQQVLIRERARQATPECCPLLLDGLCQLYVARPLICRTHGLPLLVVTADTKTVDYCPQNFAGISSLPGWAVLDLEQMNAALTAINALFIREAHGEVEDRRLSLAETLLLPLP